MIITLPLLLLLLLLAACAPVVVPLPYEGYDLVDEVPLSYDADAALWAGSYDTGCDDDAPLLTAYCQAVGPVPPDALLWLQGSSSCMVGVDADQADGPCVAWTWEATDTAE